MASQPEIQDSDGAQLRQRLDALERESAEQLVAAHAALAAAQDRSYWLDRWNVDLNALMRRPGASEFRAFLRALRAVARQLQRLRARTRGLPSETRQKLTEVRHTIEEERTGTQAEVRER